MFSYSEIPSRRKINIIIIKKGVVNGLISGLIIKFNSLKNIFNFKRKILKFKVEKNRPLIRASCLFGYKVLDSKIFCLGKHLLEFLNKMLGNYWIYISLSI